MTKIYVIGIGYKPLDRRAWDIIHNADIILASNRLSQVFKEYEGSERVKNRVKVLNNVDETIEFMRTAISNQQSAINSIVFLASGDPMFFGIGKRIVDELGKDVVEILPDMSSIQLAFARIKEPWDNAFLMSVHGGPDPQKRRDLKYGIKDIPEVLERHNKIAILTDKVNNPSTIAKEILGHSALSISHSDLKMYVCERLAYPDERITEGTPEEISSLSFSEPNVVIIQSSAISQKPKADHQNTDNLPMFGLRESEIAHSRGLITKDEIRSITVHKLRLPQKGVFWDIGAGSGSVSVEAARLCPELRVFAIEKDEEQVGHIMRNLNRFVISNVEVIKGEAPDALKDLLCPDRVFIGGSGRRLVEIVALASKMLSKTIVINAATIETLNEAIQSLENNGYTVEISEVSVSRSKAVANRKHMEALNPVFIVVGEKDK